MHIVVGEGTEQFSPIFSPSVGAGNCICVLLIRVSERKAALLLPPPLYLFSPPLPPSLSSSGLTKREPLHVGDGATILVSSAAGRRDEEEEEDEENHGQHRYRCRHEVLHGRRGERRKPQSLRRRRKTYSLPRGYMKTELEKEQINIRHRRRAEDRRQTDSDAAT